MDERPIDVLLVEDEEAHAELVSRSFEDGALPFRVRLASTIGEATRMIAEARPDLLITDLKLPDGSGTELVALNGCPAVVMTSHGDESVAVEAMKAGAIDYVVKSEATFLEMPRVAERALREWKLIVEKARLQEQLVERERLATIGTTASMLAHEIGNPLNTMYLHGQSLERKIAKMEEQVSERLGPGVSAILLEIGRLRTLLQEFRSVGKRQKLDILPADLVEIVDEVMSQRLPEDTERGIVQLREFTEASLVVKLDPMKIKQVLLNLCKNATEAMEPGGRLTVRISRADRMARVEVADTGVGIPDEVDAFEAFRTTKSEGFGLGLAIVRQLVIAHGGAITYQSKPGEGTTFVLELPLPDGA